MAHMWQATCICDFLKNILHFAWNFNGVVDDDNDAYADDIFKYSISKFYIWIQMSLQFIPSDHWE